MMTIRQMSQTAGVSARTLRHYDAIGLLRPARVTEAGYRLYDEESLRRLQMILMYRELRFPLRDIRRMLDAPDFDRREALAEQIRLLEMERERLRSILSLARQIMNEEDKPMNFKPFDREDIDRYAKEAKERWGHTEAWRASEKRGPKEMQDAAPGLMALLAQFGEKRNLPAEHPENQALVSALQDYITAHFYPCTKELLSGLGEMYTADERFRKNIDASGGEGAAEAASRAIRAYCEK